MSESCRAASLPLSSGQSRLVLDGSETGAVIVGCNLANDDDDVIAVSEMVSAI